MTPTTSIPADRRPQFGVVGGGIRGSMFAEAIAQHPGAELVAACDPAPAARATLAEIRGITVHTGVEELLAAHPELSAAVIATPDFAHRDPALRCLEAGLDLLIEKPLATDAEDARAIEAAARTAGSTVMIGFENRWNPRFAAVRDRIRSGDHGRMVNQVLDLNDRLVVPTRMLSWAASSSPGWFLMPHTLDLAMWLSDSDPVEVFARGVRRVLPARGVDTWDAVTASFAMSDGSIVVLNSQWVLPESMPAMFEFRYQANTDTSSFRLDIADGGVTEYGTGVEWLQFGVERRNGRLLGVPIDMINDFIDALNGEPRELPDLRAGRIVTEAVAALHRSLETGQPVEIPGV